MGRGALRVTPVEHDFEAKVEETGGRVGIAIRGELDLAATARLRAPLEDAAARASDALVLDLSAVRFIDSTGLHAILSVSRRMKAEGRRLMLIRPPAPVMRVFEVTRTETLLDFVEAA